ncbi:MAG: GT4 family glycosyltransferase PelF [Hyphomicrobiaceae bacterium]|nr:GT4 family glycosyltransferase PelF [Hyphomicrobiaceae bacterium]
MSAAKPWVATPRRTTDVCIIVEGCYPFVPGGVSGWIDWLIRSQPDTSFSIVSLWPAPDSAEARYAMPPNVLGFHPLYLQSYGDTPRQSVRTPREIDALAHSLQTFITQGGAEPLAKLSNVIARVDAEVPLSRVFNSPVAWDIAQRMYREAMPYGSFLHYFWAWRALLGGLFATLEFPLPNANVYHTISTGYAGLLAARAARETGRPSILTEHGIYTNERRIELLMADWVVDTLDRGHVLDDPRLDLRDMWISAFEAYAKTCYEACDLVITLYGDNQKVQQTLGAVPNKSRVIANGIDIARFGGLARAPDAARPTMALIGRVVPIKDVKAYIAAAKMLRETVPDLQAYILGPLDEDPEYTAECKALVTELGLESCIEFTGPVNITLYLPQIHVVVLTSLSESQPLTLLEAGAAGIPFVATNVGSCREIIEGRADEVPSFGPGGIVTGLVAPSEIAAAVGELLADHDKRRIWGENLRQRVQRYYTSEQAAAAYRELYQSLREAPGRQREQPAIAGRAPAMARAGV